MILRLFAAACALALVMGGASARAQAGDDEDDQTLVIQIEGDCALTVSGRAQDCQGLAYMVFPTNRRKDFTVLTTDGGWAFSGREDKRGEDGTYTLLVDSILRAGAQRTPASGQCVMQVAADGATVKSLDCQARTQNAVLTLKASGTAQPRDDNDDDDDDDDGGPDTSGFG